ncbi:MAG: hypothetical protein MJ224_02645 [archaeon]|nr:hypothetical protein [archaeon]
MPTGTGAVLACRDFIPKVVEKDEDGLKRLAIKAPILINYVGVQKGFSPSYVKNSDGKYEVELNDANEIKWQSTSIPEFTVLKDEVAPELIEAAKEVISKDSQLNGLTKLI